MLSPGIIFVLRGDWNYFWHFDQAFLSFGSVKILSFGVEIFLALRPSLRSVSVPKKFPPLRTKFFNSPSGQKSLASVRKKFPAAPQDKTYPLGQQSPIFGTKKACTSLGIPKFFGFPKMKKVQTTFRSIRKLKQNLLQQKKAWKPLKKARKNQLRLFFLLMQLRDLLNERQTPIHNFIGILMLSLV